MSAIKLATPSSGSISLSPANTASNLTITVPAVTGTMAIEGPAFFASTGYTVSLSNNTATVATSYGSPLFDTASAFNTTNGRFTPQVAGYYQVNGVADFGNSGIGSCSSVGAVILKNGTSYSGSGGSVSGSSFAGYGTSTIVFLNGSTDYIQLAIFQNTGGTVTGSRGVFSAALVRAS